MWSRGFALLFAVVVGACSSAPKPTGDGGSGGDLAMSGPADLAPRSTAGIACGATACITTAELCCTSDNGATGVCQRLNNQNCGASSFNCDGPEDCEPANPDCCVVSGIATCRQPGVCATITGAKFMCHVNADCAPGQTCTAAPKSPYSLCL